jgi:3-methylfumaryl-CoA hydratase
LQSWGVRHVTDRWAHRSERLAPEPAAALAALLDVPPPGDRVPLLWHWLHLLERPAQADLGVDGHPVRGTVPEPPGPGRRRMWAAGRVATHHPLRYGEVATRRTKVVEVAEKQGRSGLLTFVTVRHELFVADQLAVEEEQDIVYREAVTAASPAALPAGGDQPEADADWRITTSPTLLFRFSALTYNAHRIHYDRGYARDVEGYPGLVVHGPLQAMLMAEAVRARTPGEVREATFAYRLVSPVFDEEDLLIATSADATAIDATVRSGSGRVTATGRWEPA